MGIGLLLAIPLHASPIDPVQVTAAIEEQSACRLFTGGYMLSFTLRTAYAASDSMPIELHVDHQRIVQAVVRWEDADAVTFVRPGRVDAGPGVLGEPVTTDLRQPVGGLVTAHIPLSTDAVDWPAALLPGDYRVQFVLRVPVVDASATLAWIETVAPALPIRIPDPTVVQECPFDMAPADLLVADPG